MGGPQCKDRPWKWLPVLDEFRNYFLDIAFVSFLSESQLKEDINKGDRQDQFAQTNDNEYLFPSILKIEEQRY